MADLIVERIEELADMAVMNTALRSNRQRLSEEKVASYGAEQRRLKAAAAHRRAIAASRPADGEAVDHDSSARAERPPAAARRSKYLRD